ncbi:MAG: hypothetical protein Q3Y08_03670, partial [Butyricicoccus sp.]|nr:hypothetical protein [Butyricicoccus sp.]
QKMSSDFRNYWTFFCDCCILYLVNVEWVSDKLCDDYKKTRRRKKMDDSWVIMTPIQEEMNAWKERRKT